MEVGGKDLYIFFLSMLDFMSLFVCVSARACACVCVCDVHILCKFCFPSDTIYTNYNIGRTRNEATNTVAPN